jgi:hypothetical protein
MSNEYTGFALYSPFFVANKYNSRPVAARYLTDNQGNFVMNPNTPGAPYIVPLDYNPQQVIENYRRSWSDAFNRTAAMVSSNDENALIIALAAARGQIYADLVKDFSTGGPQDLQRSYNGVFGGPPVNEFTDATSLNLGLAAASGNVTGLEAAVGGGLLNLYKGYKRENVTIGPILGLRPGNYADIMEGVKLHKQRVFENMPEPQEADVDAYDFRNGGAPEYGYAAAAFPSAPSGILGSRADSLALSSFLSTSMNALNSFKPVNALLP